jgi:hypothetical protein
MERERERGGNAVFVIAAKYRKSLPTARYSIPGTRAVFAGTENKFANHLNRSTGLTNIKRGKSSGAELMYRHYPSGSIPRSVEY